VSSVLALNTLVGGNMIGRSTACLCIVVLNCKSNYPEVLESLESAWCGELSNRQEQTLRKQE
jgi:hypothetical protein